MFAPAWGIGTVMLTLPPTRSSGEASISTRTPSMETAARLLTPVSSAFHHSAPAVFQQKDQRLRISENH